MTPRSRESGFLAFLLGNPMMLLAAGLGIALVVAGISLKVQSVRLANAKTETAQAKGELAAFVGAVKQRGEEQEKASDAKEAKDRAYLKQQKSVYEKRLADLRGERDAAQRVLDHYASGRSGEVPRDSTSAGQPGQGPADSVPRAALERLARDAQETTLMFMECRDGWKAMAAR
jgi:predicted signal transduction protein with EAL and GGDEF domain